MVLRTVAPLSAAKIVGVLHMLMGLLFGGVLALVALAGTFAGFQDAGFMAPFFGVGAIVTLPLLYGCIGFVSALVGAWLYNIVAGMVGGIELDLA